LGGIQIYDTSAESALEKIGLASKAPKVPDPCKGIEQAPLRRYGGLPTSMCM